MSNPKISTESTFYTKGPAQRTHAKPDGAARKEAVRVLKEISIV